MLNESSLNFSMMWVVQLIENPFHLWDIEVASMRGGLIEGPSEHPPSDLLISSEVKTICPNHILSPIGSFHHFHLSQVFLCSCYHFIGLQFYNALFGQIHTVKTVQRSKAKERNVIFLSNTSTCPLG